MSFRPFLILLFALACAARAGAAEECSNDQATDPNCYAGGHGTGIRTCRADNNCPGTGMCWGPCELTCDLGYSDTGGYCAAVGGGTCCGPGTRTANNMCKVFDAQGNPLGEMQDAGLPDCGGSPPPQGQYCCVPGTRGNLTCMVRDTKSGAETGGLSTDKPDCSGGPSSSTSTSTAAAVAMESGNDTTQHMGSTAAHSGGSQGQSVNDSIEVISLGANQTATSGAIFCAESANALDSDPALAASDAAKCQQSFSSAAAMRAMKDKLGSHGGYTPDDTVLGKDGTSAILADFEKRYGITGDDFIRRMLGPNGGPAALENMLGSSAEKFRQALGDGKAPAGAGSESGVAVGSIDFGKPKSRAGLRDSLRAKLADTPNAKEDKVVVSLARNVASEKLTPLENVFPSGASATELTIFDIVHRKYQEKFPMLIPYRVEKR